MIGISSTGLDISGGEVKQVVSSCAYCSEPWGCTRCRNCNLVCKRLLVRKKELPVRIHVRPHACHITYAALGTVRPLLGQEFHYLIFA